MVLGNDDESYMKDMLAMFWETVADTSNELASIAAARDATALREAAHSAKGASASAGAQHLAELLERLQSAAEGEDWPEVNRIIPLVGAAFTDLKRFIEGNN